MALAAAPSICDTHHHYASRALAKLAIREHKRLVRNGVLSCWKCRVGRQPAAFPCEWRRNRWHWGHKDRGEGVG